jgi:undecaprenyl-diphosphatase
MINNLDLQLFSYINNFAGHSKALDFTGVFFAQYLAYILIAFIIILLFYPNNNRFFNRIMVIVSVFAGLVARFIVKELIILFYHRPRPYVLLSGIHKLIPTALADNYQSFPSGHAIFYFALAMGLFYFNKKLGTYYFVAAIVMCIARVFVGVHWPTDIAGGAILGMLTALLVNHLYRKYRLKIDSAINLLFNKLRL